MGLSFFLYSDDSEEMSDVTLLRDKFYKATYLALISYYT